MNLFLYYNYLTRFDRLDSLDWRAPWLIIPSFFECVVSHEKLRVHVSRIKQFLQKMSSILVEFPKLESSLDEEKNERGNANMTIIITLLSSMHGITPTWVYTRTPWSGQYPWWFTYLHWSIFGGHLTMYIPICICLILKGHSSFSFSLFFLGGGGGCLEVFSLWACHFSFYVICQCVILCDYNVHLWGILNSVKKIKPQLYSSFFSFFQINETYFNMFYS